MRIVGKNNHTISSVDDWKQFAPPKRNYQWAEGRSAFELARAWCGRGTPRMPDELSALLESLPETSGLTVETVTPEHQIRFDDHGGEPRNADLAFAGSTANGIVAVTIEAKADEPFGATVTQTLADALERRIEHGASRGVERVVDLVQALLPVRGEGQPKAGDLRYQLLTAAAGSLAYARDGRASIAVLVIHEFITDKTSDRRHAENAGDYEAFLSRIGDVSEGIRGKPSGLEWFTVPGTPLFTEGSRLLIGKVVTDCRRA